MALAQSPRLSRAHEPLAAESQMLLNWHPVYSGSDYVDDHLGLLDAFAGSGDAAVAAVRHHLRLTEDLIVPELEQYTSRVVATVTTQQPRRPTDDAARPGPRVRRPLHPPPDSARRTRRRRGARRRRGCSRPVPAYSRAPARSRARPRPAAAKLSHGGSMSVGRRAAVRPTRSTRIRRSPTRTSCATGTCTSRSPCARLTSSRSTTWSPSRSSPRMPAMPPRGS